MKMTKHIFDKQFDDILGLIKSARQKVLKSINTELIELNWQIGKFISENCSSNNWGENIVENLSKYIIEKEPEIKGFSPQNLWRMKQFYETYSNNEILSPLVREISWSNNLLILSKTKDLTEKEFYIRLSIRESYSKRELDRQIESGFFERTMLSNENNTTSLKLVHPKIESVFKDNYVLEFLNLPHKYSEKEFQKAIIANLKDFILEFGKDFTFLGEEYSIQVGNEDFYIDLLFFHRELQCLVAVELKIGSFKPEYLGKMEFYLEALDRKVKKNHENPSVGIILCKTKDKNVVEISLSRSLSPTLVSDYQTKLIDKELLRNKLIEFYNIEDKKNN
jgi:predicted nuclease of restriction endonuclease-like (RecB) superfamily